ncbi:hypothetical protein BDZ97DRAFT_2052904 [Flammula alnicola]|nr:hypothetical protein BDZ97DRAFT_2052904 [Flammula alnicola]
MSLISGRFGLFLLMESVSLNVCIGDSLSDLGISLQPSCQIPLQAFRTMGLFSRRSDLRLSSRIDTTISVTVPPKNREFSSVALSAHTQTSEQMLDDLGASQNDGLSKNEVARRLESCGENLLQGTGGVSACRVLGGQFILAFKILLKAQLLAQLLPSTSRSDFSKSTTPRKLCTVITKGRGTGVTIATAMNTQIGRIADAINGKTNASGEPIVDHRPWYKCASKRVLEFLGLRSGTPLQIKLAKLPSCSSFTPLSIAIAIIPESLIAVLTLTTAVGTRRMASKNVVVRKLDVLENFNLGEFTAETIQDALQPEGIMRRDSDGSVLAPAAVKEGLAQIHKTFKGKWKSTGDPTEVALQVFATELKYGRTRLISGISEKNCRPALRQIIERREKVQFIDGKARKGPVKRFELKAEFPFSNDFKRMTTIYLDKENEGVSTCSHQGSGPSGPSPHRLCTFRNLKTTPIRNTFLVNAEELASQGLRSIGLGSRTIPVGEVIGIPREDTERDFVFHGLAGIFDPPRPETVGAVRSCKQAGIVVQSLTSVHVTTARAIAEVVEIISADVSPSAVMTATEFDKLTDREIDAFPELVIARCAPETKAARPGFAAPASGTQASLQPIRTLS